MASVMPVRALVGVAALSTTLGLSVALPSSAHAVSEPSLTSTSSPTVRVVSTTTTATTTSTSTTAVTMPTLSYGATSTYVTRVQRILAIRQTGTYDLATVAAVKRLQTWKRISPVNGVVSGATWTALNDPTLSYANKTSKSTRATMPFLTWAASPHGRGIAYRESKLSCTIVSYNGSWRGKWQMTLSLWKSYGGLVYASSPEKASCLAQDKVAYKVWVASWWYPWGG
jgi:hypothetical protein